MAYIIKKTGFEEGKREFLLLPGEYEGPYFAVSSDTEVEVESQNENRIILTRHVVDNVSFYKIFPIEEPDLSQGSLIQWIEELECKAELLKRRGFNSVLDASDRNIATVEKSIINLLKNKSLLVLNRDLNPKDAFQLLFDISFHLDDVKESLYQGDFYAFTHPSKYFIASAGNLFTHKIKFKNFDLFIGSGGIDPNNFEFSGHDQDQTETDAKNFSPKVFYIKTPDLSDKTPVSTLEPFFVTGRNSQIEIEVFSKEEIDLDIEQDGISGLVYANDSAFTRAGPTVESIDNEEYKKYIFRSKTVLKNLQSKFDFKLR